MKRDNLSLKPVVYVILALLIFGAFFSTTDSTFATSRAEAPSESPFQGYPALSDAQTVMTQTQDWETSSPHTMDVLELNMGGYKYWGYYALQNESNAAIGLARSNDLVNWTKYEGNPIIAPGRWAQVLKVGETIYMTYTRYSESDKKSVLASSPASDGINFKDIEDIVPYSAESTNPAGSFYYNPNDSKFYFYWHNNMGTGNPKYLKVKVADSPLDLDVAPETTVLTSSDILAAPDIFYHDGVYYLTYEIIDANGIWYTDFYYSNSPTSGFIYGGNILDDGSACWFHQEFDGVLYGYYCKLTGDSWTLDLRTSDLSTFSEFKPSPETKKTRPWQYITLGVVLIIVVGFVLSRVRGRRR